MAKKIPVPLFVAVGTGLICYAAMFLMPTVPVAFIMGDQWAGEHALLIGFLATPLTGGIAWGVAKNLYKDGM